MIRQFSALTCLFILLMVSAAVSVNGAGNLLQSGFIDYTYTPAPIYGPSIDAGNRLLFQTDSRILTFGTYEPHLNGDKLFRFESNGVPDSSFVPFYPASNTDIDMIGLQTDGKIIYSYKYLDVDQSELLELVRLNPDGSFDGSFDYTYLARGNFKSIIGLPDGGILLTGLIQEKIPDGPPGPYRNLTRLNPDGSLDLTFQSLGETDTIDAAVQPDARIVVLKAGGELVRVNSDGSIDSSFSVSIPGIRQFDLLPGGEIMIRTPKNMFRIENDGSVDTTFQGESNISPSAKFVTLPDGSVLLSSRCEMVSVCRAAFERLNSDGSNDGLFRSSYVSGKGIHIGPDGDVFSVGETVMGNRSYGIVKIHVRYTPSNRKSSDFDGDGRSDLAVFRPSEGNWYILLSSTNTFKIVRFGLDGDKPVAADYDGDAIADIAVYRPSTGIWYRINSSDNSFFALRFGLAEDIPTPNDYDGDGKDDISLFRPSDGNWYRINSSDSSFSAFHFGAEGDKPASGDYDGDSKADFAVWRPSEGYWYQTSSLTNTFSSRDISYFDGDVAAPGDIDGDGRIDIVYWKGFTQAWRGVFGTNGSGIYIPMGLPGDIPLTADFDGDGEDELTLWRPSTGVWWFLDEGVFSAVQFGTAGDIPIQTAYTH